MFFTDLVISGFLLLAGLLLLLCLKSGICLLFTTAGHNCLWSYRDNNEGKASLTCFSFYMTCCCKWNFEVKWSSPCWWSVWLLFPAGLLPLLCHLSFLQQDTIMCEIKDLSRFWSCSHFAVSWVRFGLPEIILYCLLWLLWADVCCCFWDAPVTLASPCFIIQWLVADAHTEWLWKPSLLSNCLENEMNMCERSECKKRVCVCLQ